MKKYLIVGLGNIGEEYRYTRHNIGFLAVEHLAQQKGVSFETVRLGDVATFSHKGRTFILLKPSTFMNLSGNALIEIVNFYKLDPKKDIIVVYDDMSLDFGDIRIREKGSSGGHNGIKSIISHIGEEFIRIKCGIGAKKEDAVEHVLGEFSQSEQKELVEFLEKLNECIIDILTVQNLDRTMQKYNKKKEKLK